MNAFLNCAVMKIVWGILQSLGINFKYLKENQKPYDNYVFPILEMLLKKITQI